MSAAPENLSPAEAMLLRECNRRALSMETLATIHEQPGQGFANPGFVDTKAESREMVAAAASLIRKGLADLWVEDHWVDATSGRPLSEAAGRPGEGARQVMGDVRVRGVVVMVPTERGMNWWRSEGGAS